MQRYRNSRNDRGPLKVKSRLSPSLKFPHQGEWNRGPPDYFKNVESALRPAAQAILDSALLKLKTITDKTLKISSEIIQGSPAQVIVDEAESWGAELIIMGSRGLGVWSRLLLGSVSNAVVHHAKCSVEVVRTSPDPATGKKAS